MASEHNTPPPFGTIYNLATGHDVRHASAHETTLAEHSRLHGDTSVGFIINGERHAARYTPEELAAAQKYVTERAEANAAEAENVAAAATVKNPNQQNSQNKNR
jgi:hypothetical protein